MHREWEREREIKKETRMHRLAPRDRLCSWNMGMISQVNHIQAVLVQVSNTQQIKLMKRYTSGVKKRANLDKRWEKNADSMV